MFRDSAAQVNRGAPCPNPAVFHVPSSFPCRLGAALQVMGTYSVTPKPLKNIYEEIIKRAGRAAAGLICVGTSSDRNLGLLPNFIKSGGF